MLVKKLNLKRACNETLFFSLPLIGFRIVANIGSFVAMLFIASLGHRELAASALVTPIQITLNLAGWSVIFALSIVTGHVFGQGKHEELGKVLRQGWLISAILALPLMIIFWNVGPALRLLHQQNSLIQLIQPYFHVLAFGVPASMIYIAFIQFVTGIGKPKIVLFFSLFGITSVVAIGYPLLFGKFGFPRLGMVGMAYANVASFWLACIISLIYLKLSPYCKKYQIFKFSSRVNFNYLKQILQIGVPMSAQFIAELLAFSFAAVMVGWINQASLAATQITNQLNMIMIMGPLGIAQAAGVLIGQARGRGEQHSCRTYGEAAIIVGFIFTLIVAMLYWLFPLAFIRLYSVNVTNPANNLTVHIAITLFVIVAFSQIADGIRNITTGALRGVKDSAAPMWIGIIAAWGIAIPAGYIFGIRLHGGAPAICLAFIFAWTAAIPFLIRRFYVKTAIFNNET